MSETPLPLAHPLECLLLDLRARHLAVRRHGDRDPGFVWLTPPDWLKDPMASGGGPIAWLIDVLK